MNDDEKYFWLTVGIFCEILAFPFISWSLHNFKDGGPFLNWTYAPTFVLLMCVWTLKVWKAWRQMRRLPDLGFGFYVNPNGMLVIVTGSMIGFCTILWVPVLLRQPDLLSVLAPCFSFIVAVSVLGLVAYENKWYKRRRETVIVK